MQIVKNENSSGDSHLNKYEPLMIEICRKVCTLAEEKRIRPEDITDFISSFWKKEYADTYKLYNMNGSLFLFIDKDVALKFDLYSNPNFQVIGISEDLIKISLESKSSVHFL